MRNILRIECNCDDCGRPGFLDENMYQVPGDTTKYKWVCEECFNDLLGPELSQPVGGGC